MSDTNENKLGEHIADELGIDWEENELMRAELEEADRMAQVAQAPKQELGGGSHAE